MTKSEGMDMKRESFGSRLGFILVSAGCAIGIGNVWRFPYVAGENGGGVFVLFYLLFLLLMGVPVLTMELAVGRAGRSTAVKAFKVLGKPGSKWHIHGWVGAIGCLLLMMYYTVVSGWMLGYFFKFLSGVFEGKDAAAINGVFAAMKDNPGEMILWMALIVVLGFLVCSFGLQKGLERISKWMMSALLVLIVALAINSILLPGGGQGLRFFLLPDFSRAGQVGLGNVITAAMNQSFFTLSIGIGSMEIFGSYMSSEQTLAGESVRICALDTFVAMMSGLIIFPACFAFGVPTDSGAPLIFQTLPNVFASMAGGRLWGSLFFLFMTFASFTTVIAVFENLMTTCMDNFGWSRKKATWVGIAVVFVASIPCVLGHNLWKGFTIGGLDILGMEDFAVSNLLLPIGSLVYLLFCVTKWGWGYDRYMAEANTGKGLKLPSGKWMKNYLRFVMPVMIFIILLQGLL